MVVPDFLFKYRRVTCFVAGVVATFAMAPWNFFPALLGLAVLLFITMREAKPKSGAMDFFCFAMGYFVVGLYWVQYALVISLGDHWWARLPAVIGLPLLLVPGWLLAGWLTVKYTATNSLARGFLFIGLIALAEYNRAFLMTGFPWNLFAYTWAGVPPMAQVASIGGVYLLNILTIFWMAVPVMLWLVPRYRLAIGGLAVASIALSLGYGAMRLHNNPTVLRDDVMAVIVQPNIAQEDKWDPDKAFGHFQSHIDLSNDGLQRIDAMATKPATVAVIWPETSLDEYMMMKDARLPAALNGMMAGRDYKTFLVSGLWRQDKIGNFNSITILSQTDGQLAMDDLYDKYRLVPFGEYIPLLDRLGVKALTGFSGFQEGTGPKVLNAAGLPPVAPAICYEAIFPWALQTDGAEWIVNASNDGWYGDTSGPQQHLAMTRFRAIEQGKPVIRSTTTGVSAVIDSYGRVLDHIPYSQSGNIITQLPKVTADATTYTLIREGLFLAVLSLFLGFTLFLRRKHL